MPLITTQTIMVDAKPAVRKQILRELQIMNDCRSPYIVGYYDCFPVGSHVGLIMEYMDLGSAPRLSITDERSRSADLWTVYIATTVPCPSTLSARLRRQSCED